MKITSPGSATLRGSNPPAAAAVAAEHPVAIAGRLLVRYGLFRAVERGHGDGVSVAGCVVRGLSGGLVLRGLVDGVTVAV